MGEVVPFRKKLLKKNSPEDKSEKKKSPKEKSLKEKHKGNTLCRHGHHKWEVETEKRFDVKRGKLVTSYRCTRCGKTRNEAR